MELSAEVWALSLVALALQDAGHLAESNRLFDECRTIADRIVDQFWLAKALSGLATNLAKAGRMEEAQHLFHKPVEIAGGMVDDYWAADAFFDLAMAFHQIGQEDQANRFFLRSEAAIQTVPEGTWRRAQRQADQATALFRVGRRDQAARFFQDAIQTIHMMNNSQQTLQARLSVARRLASTSQYALALNTLQARNLDQLLGELIKWSLDIKDLDEELWLRILREAARIAGWVREDWHEIYETLRAVISE